MGDDEVKINFIDYGEPFNLPNHPVVGVTWYEALAFTRWLTDHGHESGFLPEEWLVALPSEAEWEKAARGGLEILERPHIVGFGEGLAVTSKLILKPNPLPGRLYPWGNDFAANQANMGDTGIGATSTPGCFSGGSSPLGIEDLSGNVWEWCRTKWESNYEGYKGDNSLEGVPPRVAWWRFPLYYRLVRCAYRRVNPTTGHYTAGFG